ncbi:PDZ/DHR/GLGF domain protein [Gemmatirosa kalamazoonensis]|uniref:PDZ/DHR/GLGF domain protein n=1 Tax=Gemmatirosa kalamazoonensis TaxID=861299 RepID=W0RHQ7_9BACT|nr:PDZ domain-containing protein [Gemmatirosa kalamazoonensis]AHG89962.1 PDZ/DHR/GLGF domain protein [Gemmatirosa kalamazoonensis]
MRPTVYLTAAAALAAASLLAPHTAAAQDAGSRRTYETLVQALGPGGVSIWRSDDSTRAVLGISLAPARSSSDTIGVRIADVAEDGPAAKAGIEEGDRIVSIDGTTLRVDPADADDPVFRDLGSRRLQRALAKHKPGDEVSLVVQRGRETRTVRVKTVAASSLEPSRAYGVGFGPGGSTIFRSGASARAWADSIRTRMEQRPALGLTVGTTGSRRDTLGLFVSSVATDGPAEKAGIVEGARIAGIDGVDLRLSRDDAEDPEFSALRARRFTRELEKHKAGDDITLRVWQSGSLRTLTVKAARAADVWKNRSGFAFSFGDGDGAIALPRTPVAPLLPSTPMRMDVPSLRVLPRTWMSAPVRPALPRASVRTTSFVTPRVVVPRAVAVPRARRVIEM